MTPILQIDAVSRRFGRKTVVDGVSLDIRPGEIHALVGPNGSGKSTLARLAAGLLRPHAGTIRVAGEDPRHAAEARRHVGYVGHASLLYGDLTPVQNLRFVGQLYQLDDLDRTIAARLDQLGVGPERDVPVRSLSRGMTQRIALARSLLHRPSLLIWDEPFTGLDVASSVRAVEAIQTAHAGGAAVVVISHDLAELWRLTAAIHVLVRGALRTTADTSMVLEAFRVRYAEVVDG